MKKKPQGVYNAANARGKCLQVNKTTKTGEGSLVQMSLLPLPSSLHRHASGIGETQEDAGKLGGGGGRKEKLARALSVMC